MKNHPYYPFLSGALCLSFMLMSSKCNNLIMIDKITFVCLNNDLNKFEHLIKLRSCCVLFCFYKSSVLGLWVSAELMSAYVSPTN